MADAIVLITTQADKVSEAAKKIVEIPGARTSIRWRVTSIWWRSSPPTIRRPLDDHSRRIAKVPGVAGTQTLMAFRTYSREDDLAAFDLGGD